MNTIHGHRVCMYIISVIGLSFFCTLPQLVRSGFWHFLFSIDDSDTIIHFIWVNSVRYLLQFPSIFSPARALL